MGEPGRSLRLKRLLRDCDAGNTDAQLFLGYIYTDSGGTADHAQGKRLLAEAQRKGHPAALYALGRLAESGRGSPRKDPARAAALYSQGFAATRHIGCALGLLAVAQLGPEGGEGLAAAEARLIALATAPGLVALADATGSRSCVSLALWTAGKALRKHATAAHEAGDSARESQLLAERLRVFDAGVEAGDEYMMCKVAKGLVRPKSKVGRGLVSQLGPCARAEALCAAPVWAAGRPRGGPWR